MFLSLIINVITLLFNTFDSYICSATNMPSWTPPLNQLIEIKLLIIFVHVTKQFDEKTMTSQTGKLIITICIL